MIERAPFPNYCIRVNHDATKMVNAKSLTDARLNWNGNSGHHFNHALDEKPKWLRWDSTFETPAKNPIDQNGMEPLGQNTAD
jgi:hypothetical protein